MERALLFARPWLVNIPTPPRFGFGASSSRFCQFWLCHRPSRAQVTSVTPRTTILASPDRRGTGELLVPQVLPGAVPPDSAAPPGLGVRPVSAPGALAQPGVHLVVRAAAVGVLAPVEKAVAEAERQGARGPAERAVAEAERRVGVERRVAPVEVARPVAAVVLAEAVDS